MKNLLKTIIVLGLIWSSSYAGAQVYEETATSNTGIPLLRLVNSGNYPVSCYFSSQGNFLTFYLNARSYSMWLPVYGYYEWECEY